MDMAVSFTEGQYAVKKHSEEQICWRVNIPEWSGYLQRMEWIAFKCDCPMPMSWPKAHKENGSQWEHLCSVSSSDWISRSLK